jgi:hypothetical protein
LKLEQRRQRPVVVALLRSSFLYRRLVDGNAQVPVPGATSEKFIPGTFLLDAFLHSQGQIRKDGQRIVLTAGAVSRFSVFTP